jgi:hypothetical protein
MNLPSGAPVRMPRARLSWALPFDARIPVRSAPPPAARNDADLHHYEFRIASVNR